MPNLNLVWMPDDHTAGVGTGAPNPVAEVADNDLAVGRMVDRISHSSIWKSSAVFVIEDDTQAGADHVDGHRGPLYVASPYAKRGVVDSTFYTQLNVVKTIEQILGIAPMNQEDRAAVPMTDVVHQHTRTSTPFTVVPNQIPLTQGLPTSTSTPSRKAAASPAAAGGRRRARRWPGRVRRRRRPRPVSRCPNALSTTSGRSGAGTRKFTGRGAMVDWANAAQLNRLDWYSAHNWTTPYPGDAKILAPNEVPGTQPAERVPERLTGSRHTDPGVFPSS